MKDYVFVKEISCPSVRHLVKVSKKTANSLENHLLAKDACILCLMNIAIARMHR